ncbi:hypothetical protein ACTZWT_12180 [Rhodopseudomonas sp. NSM]|uniref:hypothetical protein n=1 Tax=Rhodopseudomonas sp. NSM TaxID=3457630 RepID=UPI00403606BE
MGDEDIRADQIDLKREQLELDRYRARLDFWKFVLGSVFVAIAIAAIPPGFQLATAFLEAVRLDKERMAKQQEFRDNYVKDFLSNALDQDIELRIRLAKYFSYVAGDTAQQGWSKYHAELQSQRNEIRQQINQLEEKWLAAVKAKPLHDEEIERLERNLRWLYKEVGYHERDRSVIANPRAAVVTLPSPPNKDVTATNYQVFVQFAGVIARDDVRSMMRRLRESGWNVQGVEQGGERTAAAANVQEIRYHDKADEVAANQLAQAVQLFSLTTRPIIPRLNPLVSTGSLEIWISR